MNISKGTVIRAAFLLLGLVNLVLVNTGHSVLPISEAWLEEVITDTWVVVASAIAYWKNNSFTKAALEGDAIMRSIKILSKLGAEAVEEFSNGKGDENE